MINPKIGDKVKVTRGSDEMFDQEYLGAEGKIVGLAYGSAKPKEGRVGMSTVGESENDPAITVQFELIGGGFTTDGFWQDELDLVGRPDYIKIFDEIEATRLQPNHTVLIMGGGSLEFAIAKTPIATTAPTTVPRSIFNCKVQATSFNIYVKISNGEDVEQQWVIDLEHLAKILAPLLLERSLIAEDHGHS